MIEDLALLQNLVERSIERLEERFPEGRVVEAAVIVEVSVPDDDPDADPGDSGETYTWSRFTSGRATVKRGLVEEVADSISQGGRIEDE